MTIRKALKKDLNTIIGIYDYAREFMAGTGNPHQWGDDGYPLPEILSEDIEKKRLYVIENGGSIDGVFMLLEGIDPTYSVIKNGKWLNDEPYVTIHRIAGSGRTKGILKAAVEFAKGFADNIRIDTHDDNLVMQSAVAKCGFLRCGTIFLENGDPRIAYQIKVR